MDLNLYMLKNCISEEGWHRKITFRYSIVTYRELISNPWSSSIVLYSKRNPMSNQILNITLSSFSSKVQT